MKTVFLITLALAFNFTSLGQVPEWMIVDLQDLIQPNYNTEILKIDLSNQEILKISEGVSGEVWFTTQNYYVQYLPNNFVVYNQNDLENPLYFFSNSVYLSTVFFSKIYNNDLVDKYPNNTWVRYYIPESYEYILWTEDEKVREKCLQSYSLRNYSVPLSFDKEIPYSDIYSNILTRNTGLWIDLIDETDIKNNTKLSFADIKYKLSYSEVFQSKTLCDQVFDIERDSFGNLWIATGKRLIRFDGIKFFEEAIPAIVLERDLENNLWIGTAAYNSLGNLIKFDGSCFTYFNSLNSPLPANSGILDIMLDKLGNLWLSLKRTGIPGKLEALNLAIFNPSGLKQVIRQSNLSITSMRRPIFKNNPKFFVETHDFRLFVDNIFPSDEIVFFLDDTLIYSIKAENPSHNEININFNLDLYQAAKHSVKVYLTNSKVTRTKLAYFDIDLRFNEAGFYLAQNDPNPFSIFTKIEYSCWDCKAVELNIFDKYGRKIEFDYQDKTSFNFIPYLLSSNLLPNGIYYYLVTGIINYPIKNEGGVLGTKTMVLFDPEKIITLPRKVSKP